MESDESNPDVEETNPDTEETNPDTEETNPDTEESNPETKETNPDTEESIPETEETNPDMKESNPDTHCNCKRTNCLHVYCECFSTGIYCQEGCACKDCHNKSDKEDTVEAARELTEQEFDDLNVQPNITGYVNPANSSSARRKRGCNCEASRCLMKNCNCYRAKVGCFDECRCVDCRNSFGEKPAPLDLRNSSSLCPKQHSLSKLSGELHSDNDANEMVGDHIPDSTNAKKSRLSDQPIARKLDFQEETTPCPETPSPTACCFSEDRLNPTENDDQDDNHEQ